MSTVRTPIIDKNGKATHVYKAVGPVKASATRAPSAPTPPRPAITRPGPIADESERARLVTTSTLKERQGWTDAAIKKFLGEPDELRENPRYRSAAPMKLFRIGRIEDVERTPEWAEWDERSTRRSRAASAAIERRQEIANAALKHDLDAFLAGMEVSFRAPDDLTEESATRAAIDAYNERQRDLAVVPRHVVNG